MHRDPLTLVNGKMTRAHLQFTRITLVTLQRMEGGGGRQTQRQGGHISFLGLPLTNYNKLGEELGGLGGKRLNNKYLSSYSYRGEECKITVLAGPNSH